MTVARLGTPLLLLALTGAGTLAGCNSHALGRDGGENTPSDDAGAIDAATVDAGTRGPPDGALGLDGGMGGLIFDESPTNAGSCYDGRDNDLNEELDCSDTECRGLDPVCCIGEPLAACCAETASSLALSIPTECANGPVAECGTLAAHLVPFGNDAPVFEAGALIPQGGQGQGGIAIGGALDPRGGTTELSATIRVPSARCEGCVDAAGIAFVDEVPAPGTRASVRLGVLAVGGYDELVVQLDDEVIARQALAPETREVEVRVGLELGVAAYYELPGEDRVYLDTPTLPTSLVPVALGRTANRSADEEAIGILSAQLSLRSCESPRALVSRAAPVFPSSASASVPAGVGRPSVAETAGGTRWVALEVGGALYVVGENDFGELVGAVALNGDLVLSPSGSETALRDPWLVAEADRFVLYFVAEDEGDTAIYRALGGPDFARTFAREADPILKAGDLGVEALGAPTVLPGATPPLLIATVRDDGVTHLVAFTTDPADRWGFRGADREGSTVWSPRAEDLFAFDRDTVGAPALIASQDPRGRPLLYLYYAGTRGTRSGIGALASQDGGAWRPLDALLTGDGVGFDALGVFDPAPFLEAGHVELLYRAWDGTESVIGRAGPRGMGDE